ncbi:metal ABC transporter permease, partial [Staphylococcus aureus]
WIITLSFIKYKIDLFHILLDNLLSITYSVLLTTIVLGLIVVHLIIILYRHLMLSTFYPSFSKISGLDTTLLHY